MVPRLFLVFAAGFGVWIFFSQSAAVGATIEGNLYDLETLTLEKTRVAIRVVDFKTNTLIPVSDITDPKKTVKALAVVTRVDGQFKIDIPDAGVPLRIITLRLRRPDRAEVDTQIIRNIVVEAGQSYRIDTTVPELPTCAPMPCCSCRHRWR